MAPLDLTSLGSAAEPLVHVALGIGFGFVLERAGFGNAKKLTNQFYLNDMTVLKVMFTAIITAAVLLLVATTFGVLNYDELWINPTYLSSGIVGGLLFGVGFVVGGYCPGTALVSAATLKLDGILFIFGVLGGIFVFGYTEPSIDAFWNDSGNYGRLTLHEWLGLPMPIIVNLVVILAISFFAGGEWIERLMKGPSETQSARSSRAKYQLGGAFLAITALVALVWPSTKNLRQHSNDARIEASIEARKIAIDARELADLMSDRRLAVSVLDFRSDDQFNRFHLIDALPIKENQSTVLSIPARNVKVLVADDELTETAAYRIFARQRVENLYILAGGLPAWMALFEAQPQPVERLAALGEAHPYSRPPPASTSTPTHYVSKVKRPGLGAKKSGGGCGG